MELLNLDPTRLPPRGRTSWLTTMLRDALTDGSLAIGARLPASRTLAGQLGLSRGVVVEAYQRLVDEGLLVGRRGGGTVVRAAPVLAASAVRPADPPVDLDLSPGLPDLSAFPHQTWLRAERAVLAGITPADLGYGDPRGTPALREALAGRLARTRGIHADPADLIVVNGVAQGLALVAQALVARGMAAAGWEDPGSQGARDQTQSWGLATVPVPVDASGLDVDALTRTGVEAVFVTPAHQFPTGVVLAAPRRRALVDWAHRGGLIVEDDYDAEHRYDRAPVAALHALAPGHVVYLGSVSKTLAPALRLGWMLAPAALRAELVERKYHSDINSPALPQLTLAQLITSGALDKHLRLVRARHRTRRDALVDALARHLPDAEIHGIAAGLHLLVTLPQLEYGGDVTLATRARAAGVAVHPLSRHRLTPGPAGLVLGYAAATPDQLREAAGRLGALIR